MRKVFCFFIPVFVVCLTLLFPAGSLVAQVAINEFMPDPNRDWDGDGEYSYRNDEWVEIVNGGESAIDLSGYRLADGDEDPVWRYGFTGFLPPGAVMVVYGSDSRAWEETNGLPVYGLSLNNDGDRLSLYQLEGADTVLVDTILYTGKAVGDDRSIGRNINAPGEWVVFDAYNPCPDNSIPAGNGCVPTPGLVNNCTTGAEPVSWGRIKNENR
ncbi:MAG: lamin tail domain-containing protein [Candidatus Krumholzibacteriota bacterium]|nr:lamin tail domain-containing protein [Candidatus Krumholzibacteriota bacterium]